MNTLDETIAIDIDTLINEIRQNLHLPGMPMEAEEFSIFRVPEHFQQKNKELFKPRMISIGPYYNGNAAFQPMEKHKWRYLRDFLSRNTRNNLEHCINELRGLEAQARRCYFEEVLPESNKFIMMMLLDGCFIIEFLIRWHYGLADPIFVMSFVLPAIRNDLLLLENQIPFFVIQKLFDLILTCSDPVPAEENTPVVPRIPSLIEMLSEYLSGENFSTIIFFEIKHILHLYYHICYSDVLPQKLSPKHMITSLLKELCCRTTKLTNVRSCLTIPSATELIEAGINIKQRSSKNILDIRFQNGTLEIPFISIEETRRSRLLSLVCLEQCNFNRNSMKLTSYVLFMSSLLKTARDVTLLKENGILADLQATNEELVSFLDGLNEGSYLDYNALYLTELFIEVNTYYLGYWPRWWASLKRKFFNNPWSFLSFTAVFAVLTFLQTMYSILSYYYPKN